MAIGGSKRESKDFSKKVGFTEVEVVTFNPDREQLINLLEVPEDKEADFKDPEYLGEKEGNTTMRVSVWLRDVKTKELFNLSFFLEDKEVWSKAGDKAQYINSIGRTTYSDSPENLREKFAAHSYHIARVGEADLVGFLDAWLDLDNDGKCLEVDWQKLMKGSVKEFTELLKTNLPRTIVVQLIVKVKDGEDGVKTFQGVYNRMFIPGFNMKFIRNTNFTPELLRALREKDAKKEKGKNDWLKAHEKFAVELSNPEYPLKDCYYLGEAKDYNPDDFLQATDAVIADDDASY